MLVFSFNWVLHDGFFLFPPVSWCVLASLLRFCGGTSLFGPPSLIHLFGPILCQLWVSTLENARIQDLSKFLSNMRHLEKNFDKSFGSSIMLGGEGIIKYFYQLTMSVSLKQANVIFMGPTMFCCVLFFILFIYFEWLFIYLFILIIWLTIARNKKIFFNFFISTTPTFIYLNTHFQDESNFHVSTQL